MVAPTRLNSFTYGGNKVGESTAFQITDIHTFEKTYETLSVEFDIVTIAATATALNTAVAAFETAWRKPNQTFKITIDSIDFLDLSHAANTGFNSRTSIQLIPTHRSKLSRAYTVRVDVGFPADLAGQEGRQDSTVSTSIDGSGNRFLSVSARYTAVAGDAALAKALAEFATYVGTIQTLVAAASTWQATEREEVTFDDQNKVATITGNFRTQDNINESAIGADDPQFEVEAYEIITERPSERAMAGSNALPLTRATVSFSVAVKASVTKDLKTVFAEKIRPYLKTLLTTKADATGVTQPITSFEAPRYDAWNNRITGSISYLIPASSMVSANQRITEQEFIGNSLVPVLSKDRFEKDLHTGPAQRVRTVIIRTVELNKGGGIKKFIAAAKKKAEADGYLAIQEDTESDSIRLKVAGVAEQLVLIEQAAIMRFEFRSKKRPNSGKKSQKGRTLTSDVQKAPK